MSDGHARRIVGQKPMAQSTPVVIASDQGALPVTNPDFVGLITTAKHKLLGGDFHDSAFDGNWFYPFDGVPEHNKWALGNGFLKIQRGATIYTLDDVAIQQNSRYLFSTRVKLLGVGSNYGLARVWSIRSSLAGFSFRYELGLFYVEHIGFSITYNGSFSEFQPTIDENWHTWEILFGDNYVWFYYDGRVFHKINALPQDRARMPYVGGAMYIELRNASPEGDGAELHVEYAAFYQLGLPVGARKKFQSFPVALPTDQYPNIVGSWDYISAALTGAGTVEKTGRCVAIRVFANGTDSTFYISGLDYVGGSTITVRSGTGFDLGPEAQITDPIVTWVSGSMDVFIAVVT